VHERLCRVGVQGSSDSSELAKTVKTRRTDSGDVLIKAQLRRKEDAKDPNMVARHDRFIIEPWRWTVTAKYSCVMSRTSPEQFCLLSVEFETVSGHLVADTCQTAFYSRSMEDVVGGLYIVATAIEI